MNTNSFKVIVRGGYGYCNLGDDLLMLAIDQLLASEDLPITHIFQCDYSEYLTKWIPNAIVVPKEKTFLTAGLVLYGGGTQFYSFKPDPKECRGLNRLLNISRTPLSIIPKVLRRIHGMLKVEHVKHWAAIGIGIGPFVENSKVLENTKHLFLKMDHVSVRDIESYNLCKRWGIHVAKHSTDLCFLPAIVEWIRSQCSGKNANPDRVGFVVRDWPHTESGELYSESILSLVQSLSLDGYSPEFFLFKKDDIGWQKELQKTGYPVHIWQGSQQKTGPFFSELEKCSILVTARYHGAVLAAIMRRPCICIDIDPKLSLLSQVLGSGSETWSHPFSIKSFFDVFNTLIKRRDTAEKHLMYLIEEQQNHALVLKDNFLHYLKKIIK